MTSLPGRRGRRGPLFCGVGIAALAIAGAAFAFFVSTDSTTPAAAVADAIQAGATPTLGGVSGANVTLNWTATTTVGGGSVSGYAINRYNVASGGTPTAATGGCAGTVAALTCTEQGVPDGAWYYTVTPKIGLWTGAESGRRSALVDTTAPATTDNTASIGSGWFSVTKTVTLSATDTGGSGVAATYYTTDGTTPTTSSSQGTSVVLSADGVYTIKYFSVDNAGNTEAVKTAGTAIRIDKTNPTSATLSLPAFVKNGQALTDAATDLTVNGATSGVASVSYNYCTGASCTPSTLIGTSSTGATYSVTWSSQPADSVYRIQAVVTDGAGNTTSSNIVSTTVDNSAPSGGSVAYTNGYFTTASIAVTFANGTDTGSGINSATTQLQRASATLSGGSCSTFGSFSNLGSAGQASPYTDTSVASGACYQYQYVVSDNAGNTQIYTSTNVAKVDTTAPTFSVSASGTFVYASGMAVFFNNPAGSRSFTVTAADPESGIGSSSFPAAPTGWTRSLGTNAATYTWTTAAASSSVTPVTTTNGAGTGSGNQTVTVTYDNTAPTTTAVTVAPTDNATTGGFVHQGGQYYVYVAASDGTGSGIAGITANVGNITTGQTSVPLVAGSWTVGATTYNYRSAALTASNPLGAGAKTYTATLTDNVGNSATPAASSVTVDNTNPTGSITAPANGWATASTTVTSNSADATAGVFTAQFQYSVHNANSWTTIATDTSGPYTTTWNTTSLTDGGSYDLRVVTEDNAGNTSTSSVVQVTVDRSPPAAPSSPTLSAGSDTGTQGDNATTVTTPALIGTAEAGSTVTIYDGATQVGSGTASAGNYSITVSALALGSHSITATATDAAGNVSVASGVSTVTIVAPLAVTSISSSNTSGGTAGKAESGDTFSVTFNNALDPTTVDTSHAQTITMTGSSTTTTITMTGLSVASGFSVPSNYEKSGNTSSASGSLSLSNGNKTVTFTITSALSNSGNVKIGTAGTFSFPPLATIADTYGDGSAPAYSQSSALLLF